MKSEHWRSVLVKDDKSGKFVPLYQLTKKQLLDLADNIECEATDRRNFAALVRQFSEGVE